MPTLLLAHLHFCQPHKVNQKMQKSYQANALRSVKNGWKSETERRAADNN